MATYTSPYSEEEAGTNGPPPYSEENNDDEKLSDSDIIKLDLLRGLLRKNVNLSDIELAELTGFSTNRIRDIRSTAIKSTSIDGSDSPLTWDYVLAFNVGDKDEKHRRKPSKRDLGNKPEHDNDAEWDEGMPQDKYYGQIFNNFWQRLESAKLSVEAYRSPDKTLMFLVVGITEENLKMWADERDTDLLIDPKGGVEFGRTRNFALAKRTRLYANEQLEDEQQDNISNNNKLPIDDEFNETIDLSNWNNLYGEYSQQANQKVYKHYKRLKNNDDIETPFDEKTRLRIIYESIISDSNEGGAEIKIEDCLLHKNHPLIAVFPLHDAQRLEYFEAEWIKNCNPAKFMWCPLQEIRDYFGEPVAFYFAFLQFYLKWLISPAIVGIIFFIWQIAEGEIAVIGIPFLCFFMIFWSVAFVDFWARAESRYRLQWGMTKFQQKAVARPQFNGEWKHDVVTGLWSEEFSIFKRACRISAIYTFISIWLSCCVVSVIVILVQRDRNPNNISLKIGLGVANAVMIFVFDTIYKKVSQFGNEWENHRTEQDFQNALITKSFLFKFVNSFASLFYLGFIRPAQNGTYYYVHFYNGVCGDIESDYNEVGLYMGKYLEQISNDANYDDQSWSDASEWLHSNLDTFDSPIDKCIGAASSDDEADRAESCILSVLDPDNQNEAWSIAVTGYLPIGDSCFDGTSPLIPDNCERSEGLIPDACTTAYCPGVCTEFNALIDANEAILGELRIQLLTLFLTAILIQNTLEVGIPLLAEAIQDNQKKKKALEAAGISPDDEEAAANYVEGVVEDQAGKQPYLNTIDDVSELMIQFGYVTLFVMAFPLTPLLAIINNIIEMKVDAINLVKSSQRPHPNGSYGLGSWNGILSFFSVVSVATNVGLITWRSQLVTYVLGSDSAAKWIFFSCLSVFLALVVAAEKWLIPDVPLAVEQAIERQQLVEKIIILGGVVDEDGDEPPADDDDGGIQFDPSLEFIDVETLPDIPQTDIKYNHNNNINTSA